LENEKVIYYETSSSFDVLKHQNPFGKEDNEFSYPIIKKQQTKNNKNGK